MAKELKVKAVSKRNGLTVTTASLLLLALTALLYSNDLLAKLPSYFLVAFTLAGVALGIGKLREPEYSLLLNQAGITYQHTRGHWQVLWQDIQRIDIPYIDHGLEKKALPYVAIRLSSQTQLLSTISPRLASYLMIEQKDIAIAALKNDFANWQCADGSCPSEALYNFADYQGKDKVYKGLLAMFAHRIAVLRNKLGYELYIPASALDCQPDEFVRLLRQLRSSI